MNDNNKEIYMNNNVNNQPKMSLCEAAKNLVRLGLVPVATTWNVAESVQLDAEGYPLDVEGNRVPGQKRAGKKKPYASGWQKSTLEEWTEDRIASTFQDEENGGIGVKLEQDNLWCVDVEDMQYHTLVSTALQQRLGNSYLLKFVVEYTTNGVHLFFRPRRPEGFTEAQVRAYAEDGTLMVELLGLEGARACVVHPTTNYRRVPCYTDMGNGDQAVDYMPGLATLRRLPPALTEAETRGVIDALRNLNKKKNERTTRSFSGAKVASKGSSVADASARFDSKSPAGDFDTRVTEEGSTPEKRLSDMLFAAGWFQGPEDTPYGDFIRKTTWVRPGKGEGAGISGTLSVSADGTCLFTNFSTTFSDLPANEALRPSAVYAHLYCEGDMAEMYRRLRADGWGGSTTGAWDVPAGAGVLVDIVGGDSPRLVCEAGTWLQYNEEAGWSELRDGDGYVKDIVIQKLATESKAIPSTTETSQMTSFLRAMVRVQSVIKPVWLRIEGNHLACDDAGDWLPLQGESVNTTTWERRDAGSNLLTRGKINARWNPEATCPTWEQFVKESCTEPELLQMAFGLALTWDRSYNVLFLLQGPAGTGKSLALKVLELLSAGSHCCVSFSRLGGRFDSWPLTCNRLNIEADAAKTWGDDGNASEREGLIKKLTGGETLVAERKNRDVGNAKATALSFFATNELPRFADNSEALYDRIRILEFATVFRGTDKEDRNLLKKLEGELDGILQWAARGLQMLRAKGSGAFPDGVRDAELRQQMRRESKPVECWLKEEYTEHKDCEVTALELYNAYKMWCEDFGIKATNAGHFGRTVTRVFPSVTRVRVRRGGQLTYVYLGLRVYKGSTNNNNRIVSSPIILQYTEAVTSLGSVGSNY